MKKKLVTGALLAAFGAVAVTGGTLAYFTDTDNEENVFTVGEVKIELHETNGTANQTNEQYQEWLAGKRLMPGEANAIAKQVTVENTGDSDAYMWIEVWVPDALDDFGSDSDSLHFTYGENVEQVLLETEDGYNKYVHYVANDSAKAKNESTVQLLNQVYMDQDVEANANKDGYTLVDGTNYDETWELKINAVGFQAAGFDTIEDAIEEYYFNGAVDVN